MIDVEKVLFQLSAGRVTLRMSERCLSQTVNFHLTKKKEKEEVGWRDINRQQNDSRYKLLGRRDLILQYRGTRPEEINSLEGESEEER